MPITRIVYFGQSGSLKTTSGTYFIPIQSANIEVTRPIEPITAFGQFSALNTAQTNYTTCKSTLKAYLGSGSGISGLSANVLNALISDTKVGSGITITVSPGGYTMTGILTNLGIDISLGAYGMCDMGFAGLGNPYIEGTGQYSQININSAYILPVTTMSVDTRSATDAYTSGNALTGAAPTSIKFSYDLPTDTLGTLGENPNAVQGTLAGMVATKAPYKATVAIEGYGINPNTPDTSLANKMIRIGDIGITLPKAKVTSRSFNNAAGQVSATFNYTMEDTSASLSGIVVTGTQFYAYNAASTDNSNVPSYGASLPS